MIDRRGDSHASIIVTDVLWTSIFLLFFTRLSDSGLCLKAAFKMIEKLPVGTPSFKASGAIFLFHFDPIISVCSFIMLGSDH